jgi:UDP-N-acetylmuramate: L-alanyl-gamma-D-glutamyl-meso-diaminopimelate ligase
MRVHFIAVAGTGMAPLAGMLRAAGHDVSGCDTAFYPPMGPALQRWGVSTCAGFDPAHLDAAPDLVVVGNVCRPNNPEARAAIDRGLRVLSMPDALAELVLTGTAPLVVGGTHGKTTTTALAAFLLDRAGRDPGFLVGGLPLDFAESFRLPGKKRLPVEGGRRTPFVVEGDEYDTAFFDKTPKLWHYRPEVGIVTSIEHDHVDIYPDEASYLAAFAGFLERIPDTGLVVAHAADPVVRDVVRRHARAPIAWYALEGDDTGDAPPHWLAAPATSDDGALAFDLYCGGTFAGRTALAVPGEHNLKNAVAALAAVSQGYGVPVTTAMSALPRFRGVARRQELVTAARGIRLYDDFAHHPTAVRETLRALRARHPRGKLWAIYEPRTATACRALHQAAYVEAFDAADHVVLAPLGRSNIAAGEALDLDALVAALTARNVPAERAASLDAIVERIAAHTTAGDTVVVLSNGAFGGMRERLATLLG